MANNCNLICRAIFYTVLVMGPAILFGEQGKQVEMGLGIVASFATAAILNLDKIKRFKAGNLEAEMKDAIEKAYVTIDEMKKLARNTVVTLMAILAYEDRFRSIEESTKKELVKQLQKTANDLEFGNDSIILEMRLEMLRFQSYDQFCKFVASAYKSLDERTVEKATAIREALYKMVNADNIHPTRDQVIAVLGDYFNCIGDEANNQLEYYLSLEEKIASKIVD